jgi:ribokinase
VSGVNPIGRIAVVGTLNVDLVWQVAALPRPGQTIMAAAVERQFGGKGANQAVAAARQGANVEIFGAVGDDVDGRTYCEYLARESVGVSHVLKATEVATGTAHVYVDPHGENLIVVDPGANARLEIAALADVLPACRVMLTQLESPLVVVVAALRLAAERGVRSILNASPMHAGFPWGELAIDTVIVNEHECQECFRCSPADMTRMTAGERGAFLARYRVSHLVITQGAEPTLHLSAETFHRVPTHSVRPRDTVGAGDTFAGVLAAQLAEGCDWEPALRHANVAAALSTLALGAQTAMPRKADVEAAFSC